MKKQRSVILTLVFGLIFTFMMPFTAQADPPVSGAEWAYNVSEVDAESIVAHAIDTYTVLGCGTSTTDKPTFSTVRNGIETSAGPAGIVSNSNDSFRCVAVDRTTGTVYGNGYDANATDSKNRFVAIRNGRTLWSVPLDFNHTCTAMYSWDPVVVGGQVTNVTIDSNGIVHTLIKGRFNNCSQYYVTYDQSGNELDQKDLGTRGTQYGSMLGKIFTYDNETIVVDQNYMVRYYNASGAEITSRQYQMPMTYNQPYFVTDVYANDTGRVFLMTQQNVGCYAPNQQSPIFWHDSDGTSGTLNLSFGCTSFSEWAISLGAGDDVIFTSSTGVLKTPDMSGGTNHVDHTFAIDSGYTSQNIVKYWLNASGDGLMVRWLRNTSTNASDFVVDRVDGDTFALTRLKSFKAIAGGSPAYTGNMNMDITDSGDTLYGVVCQTGPYCNPVDRWAYKMPIAGFTSPITSATTNYTTKTVIESRYIAMGDSFSSGEGKAAYAPGTDLENVNTCHRTRGSYPGYLDASSSATLELTDFVACSGATTNDIMGQPEPSDPNSKSGIWNEPAQIKSLSTDTQVVTLTVGGNDVGFKNFIVGCMSAYCGSGTPAYNSMVADIESTTFHNDLKEVYSTILTSAPNAELYVVGYPALVIDNLNDECSAFGSITSSSDAGAEEVLRRLNTTISNVILAIKADELSATIASRLHYVEVNATNSPFVGNDICSDKNAGDYETGDNTFYPWNASSPLHPSAFHPTDIGHVFYREVIETFISNQ